MRNVKVDDLKPGDWLDLEGDVIADPNGTDSDYADAFALVVEGCGMFIFGAVVLFLVAMGIEGLARR